MSEPLTPTWEPRIVLQMLVASDDAAQPRGIMDCVDNDGKPYQSAHMAKLIEHARALVTAPTTIGERQAIAEAATELLERMSSTYKARNGREMGIEGDDGEKCYIVHSDEIEALRRALATPATNAPGADREAIKRIVTEQVNVTLSMFSFSTLVGPENLEARLKICARGVAREVLALRQTLPIHGEMREAITEAVRSGRCPGIPAALPYGNALQGDGL